MNFLTERESFDEDTAKKLIEAGLKSAQENPQPVGGSLK